jgi:polyphosphate glucokinase
MKVLVIDVGGTHVKILATDQTKERRVASGPTMSAAKMVKDVCELARGWVFDAVAIGYHGAVRHGVPAAEPHNLAPGWVGFDFAGAFGRPVKIVNDAAMQALGSVDKNKGTLLFLGLGTGLGSTLVVDGILVPMELAHLPYRDATFEDYVGERALRRDGRRRWRKRVADVVARLQAALLPDEVVLGGGNLRQLKTLPPGCRAGDNANAFIGGFRLWPAAARAARPARKTTAKGTRS